jgi:virulence factor Mce-like protein
MRAQRKAAGEIFDNPILIGTITLLIVLVAVYLSYIAENGLPFVPTYNISVDVQNAAELVKNADVRVGGARVGQVLTITPEPADPTNRAWPHPFARLKLSLQKSLEPLPPDTHYQVRLASVLGGKYVEVIPGSNTNKRDGLPDGGTLTLRRNLNIPFVDLDTAFSTFGPKTQRGLRNAVGAFGEAVAGRGTEFNNSVYGLHKLLGPLQSLLRLFASPGTHLSQLLSGAAATTSALAAVAPTFSSLLSDGATTFAALENAGTALGQTIDALPQTESVATTVFTNSEPVLADAASIVQDLKPGAALLPRATDRLTAIVTSATTVYQRVPQLAQTLQTALASVDRLALDPAATNTFKVLGSSDLATFGSSAFVGLGALLRAVAPAQFACNITGPWLRNFASTVSEGDSAGTWVRFGALLGLSQTFEASKPASDLHMNMYPKENSTECQAGNEGYGAGQVIGDPGRTGKVVDKTAPPAGVLARGKSVGLVPAG